jgi:hypothetical protein
MESACRQICSAGKGISKELFFWKLAFRGKVISGCVDHYWGATGIDLKIIHIWVVVNDGLVYKPSATLPAIFR